VSEDKKELTIKEAGSLGGKATLKKYGKEYFKELIKKRWNKNVPKHSN